jgi:transposase
VENPCCDHAAEELELQCRVEMLEIVTNEHALAHLIDHELDLTHFDSHYRNDERGSAAYPPAVLLKMVLFAYSQGLVSSRAIERACRDHVTFMALSGDSAPHFTTIAAFVSGREKDIAQVFATVLSICLSQGLIGRETLAIDGVKLPSNAAKARSGTRADFQKQLDKLEATASVMLQPWRACSVRRRRMARAPSRSRCSTSSRA